CNATVERVESSMWSLEAAIQRYEWGSRTAIPELLHREADGTPWAEAWFGAHPLAPSTLAEAAQPLDAAIAAHPSSLLGEDIRRAFGDDLPYLFKIIAPASPLSLQVHPSREHAAES